MITIEDVKKILEESKRKKIPVNRCSMCNYLCGYIIESLEAEIVSYDSGCDCTRYQGYLLSSLQDIANWHNMQSSEEGKLLILETLRGNV